MKTEFCGWRLLVCIHALGLLGMFAIRLIVDILFRVQGRGLRGLGFRVEGLGLRV